MADKELLEYSGIGQRLDAYLAYEFPEYSREILKSIIKEGRVLVNGQAAKPSLLLEEGDKVEVSWAAHKKEASGLEKLVIFEDKSMLAINKPSGLLVHPLSPIWESNPRAVFEGENTLAAMILAARPETEELRLPRLGIVHRLDRETSGVMLLAKTLKAQEELTRQFHDGEVSKTYVCIAVGEMKEEKGIIEVPIGRLSGDKKIKASPIGRISVTEYKVLKRLNGYTYVELYPKTGRTNQLRVHMSWLGYPVMGDTLYGAKQESRLMLHSRMAVFKHPVTRRKMAMEAPLPPDFKAVLQKLGKK